MRVCLLASTALDAGAQKAMRCSRTSSGRQAVAAVRSRGAARKMSLFRPSFASPARCATARYSPSVLSGSWKSIQGWARRTVRVGTRSSG